MIAYPITREQTAFPHIEITTTSSHSEHDSTSSADDSAIGFTSIEGGTSFTVSQFTVHFAAHAETNGITFDNMSSREFGATTSANATMTSANQSQQSFSSFSSQQSIGTDGGTIGSSSSESSLFTSSTSATTGVYATFGTTAITGYTSSKVVTANLHTTLSYWTVSGAGSAQFFTTSSSKTTALNTTGTTYASTTIGGIVTSGTYKTYIEFGNFISAQNEWLWMPFGANASPHLISDLGFSFIQSSFWPEALSIEESFASVDSTVTNNTIAVPANSFSYSYQGLFNSTSIRSIITSGDYFSRTTRTVGVPVWTTTLLGTTIGGPAQTITAASTTSHSTTSFSVFPIFSTELYPYGFGNSSTSQIVALSSKFVTSSQFSVVPAVITSFSSTESRGTEGGGATFQGGATQGGTDILYRNYGFVGFGAAPVAISPIAPVGAFISPSDLKSSNSYNFVSNLSFNKTSKIQFPVLQVFNNVNIPSLLSFTTTGTNSHSYTYTWNQDTLVVRDRITSHQGKYTLSTITNSSGNFIIAGPSPSKFYVDGGSIFGGFQNYITDAESVTFAPRAVIGTHISTDGKSSTSKTLDTKSFTSSLSNVIIVEDILPAFYVYTYAGPPGSPPFLEFERNPVQ